MPGRLQELTERLMHDDLPTQKAVAFTLLSRYFKRISRISAPASPDPCMK
jgi:hypothetical protein